MLVVEDTVANQQLMQLLLTRMGHVFTLAASGFAAVERYHGEEFDLVLMDVQMPGMDGIQTTKELRRIEREQGGVRRVPILALTADTRGEMQPKCLEAGMDGFLTKPIVLETLSQALRKVQRGKAESQA